MTLISSRRSARSAIPLPARLSGAVWGHLVGDALGVPYEFRTADQITDVEWSRHGTHDQPAGTWSDDGALMVALLDSLLEAGFEPEDHGRRSLDWFTTGRYAPGGKVFDWGHATSTAMAALKRGSPAIDAGPAGDRDCGNGSLMRILPLALVERSVPDERLVDMAHRASRVTHGHARCQVACALYSLVVRRLVAGDEDRSSVLGDAQSRLRTIYVHAGLAAHLRALDELEAWTGRSGRGFVIDSFWSAWDAFAGADSYRDAVVRAVRYGEDTDTTAAIAGGLAGAHFGVDGIPAEWRAGLRDPGIVRPLVDRLIATKRSLAALAAFAPLFASPSFEFGQWQIEERVADRPLQMPWVRYSEQAERFIRACSGGGWVDPAIDWMTWAGSADAQRLRDDHDAVASATPDDLACLLTALVRGDRFGEGTLLGAFESGLLRRIVERATRLEAELGGLR